MRFNHRCNGLCRKGIHAQVMYVDLAASGLANQEDALDVIEQDMEQAFKGAGITLHGLDLAPEAKAPDHLLATVQRTEGGIRTPNEWRDTPPNLTGVLLRFFDPQRPTGDQIEEAASATGAWSSDEEA